MKNQTSLPVAENAAKGPAKFTPGPWSKISHPNGKYFIVDNCGIPLADIEQHLQSDAQANAALIAAAPDLLEALQNIENDDGNIPGTIWDMRNNAIARATGNIDNLHNEISQAAATLGRQGGLSRSERKLRAVRDNGKKGGRPKKK